MAQYINKADVVAEIKRLIRVNELYLSEPETDEVRLQKTGAYNVLNDLLYFLDTLEVKDPYEQCVQYSSIKDAIQAHAETYSFNTESELFKQLTKEQQELWRKEIEEACINAGDAGYLFANDIRYKENLEVKDAELEKEIRRYRMRNPIIQHREESLYDYMANVAKHFFELGLKEQKGE